MSSASCRLPLRPFPRRLRILSQTLRAVPTALALLALVVLTGCSTVPKAKQTGPWNLHELSKTPAVTWGATTGLVQELYYEGEPFQGEPTRVFAYLGRPANPESRRSPAMVLVHGGGGKAFKDWAEHWAQRGYVALAMDLAGNGPDGRLPEGGPDQSDAVKFRNFTGAETRDMWSYHAVAAVVRGHSLLRSLPEVDKNRIGITGISWGGYLTCIVAGIDSRFKVAVPVYGCGFLGENSVWKDRSLAAMTPEARELWLREFDPGEYVGGVRFPILFVNGTTDFAYPMDSYQKTYRLVPEKWRHVSVAVNRPHGHIWTFPEVDAFVGSVLREEPPLVRIGALRVDGSRLSASVDRPAELKELTLCYTTDSGAWQQRNWQTIPARLENGRLTAELPPARPLVVFLALQDEAGRHISSEHLELSAP
jgi:dienelactone hydrolase